MKVVIPYVTINRLKNFIVITLLLGSFASVGQPVKYVNGKWFNGRKFKSKTMYVIDGKFSSQKVQEAETIDLAGKFCIPPLADAHTHNFGTTWNLDSINKKYVKSGILYVQVLGLPQSSKREVIQYLQGKASPDLSFATGGITSTLGHPFLQYEPRAMGLHNPDDWGKRAKEISESRIMANDAYWFLDSIQDVSRSWKGIAATKPDLIKIFLYDHNNLIKKGSIGRGGLSPEVAEEVVTHAHQAGLRVVAHVETVEDTRLAIKIGVDGLAHLPSYNWNGIGDPSQYFLSKNDYKQLRDKNIWVIPTFSFSEQLKVHDSLRIKITHLHQSIVKNLIKHKINVGLGCDQFSETSFLEYGYLQERLQIPMITIMKWATTQTSNIVFPERKIGLLKSGYEASFIVLNENPITNPKAIENPVLIVKRGHKVNKE